MVTNVQLTTRQTCSQIFLLFICDYPMSDDRLETHLNHLLKNMAYFDPKSRQTLLETLLTLIKRIPLDRLESFSEVIFLNLFLRLVNEPEHAVRNLV